MLEIPHFEENKALHAFLIENQKKLIAQKKAIIKEADGFSFMAPMNSLQAKDKAYKSNEPIDLDDISQIKVRAIINTTNIMDSHKDVHLPGLWDKSLKESSGLMHLQEHKSNSFAAIISDGMDLTAYTKTYSWKELGFEQWKGKTEALVFDSVVKSQRNPFMFDQYGKGYVKNHSVGMRYVKLVMCIDDPQYGAEYEAWEKYFPEIINPAEAEKYGYFWAVKEAMAIEGSAVPKGSNYATPTLDNNMKQEASKKDTEPSKDTPPENQAEKSLEEQRKLFFKNLV